MYVFNLREKIPGGIPPGVELYLVSEIDFFATTRVSDVSRETYIISLI